jgi:hypothetical protein
MNPTIEEIKWISSFRYELIGLLPLAQSEE